jgi:arsenate reductase
MPADRLSVLFVCTHNSARSQMAEGLLRARYGAAYDAFSAGTEKTHVRPLAVAAMDEIGIDLRGHASQTIDEVAAGRTFDVVVTVCDDAAAHCPSLPARLQNLHHGFPDPSAATGSDAERLAAFRAVREALADWIATTFDPSTAAFASDDAPDDA